MFKALYISPMIPSFRIKVTADFFKEILGFTALMKTETYAIYVKDNLTVHILPAGPDIGEMEFYLEIDDIDSLWERIKDKLQNYKVKEPFNQEYGMRECHIIIPETKTLLFVGQEIK